MQQNASKLGGGLIVKGGHIVGDYGALTSGHSMQYAPSTIMFAKDSTGCTLCCVMASNVSSPNSDRDPSKSAFESKRQRRFFFYVTLAELYLLQPFPFCFLGKGSCCYSLSHIFIFSCHTMWANEQSM